MLFFSLFAMSSSSSSSSFTGTMMQREYLFAGVDRLEGCGRVIQKGEGHGRRGSFLKIGLLSGCSFFNFVHFFSKKISNNINNVVVYKTSCKSVAANFLSISL